MLANNPLCSEVKTDSEKCCLCQSDTKEELKSPPTRYECSSDGYSMIARNVPQFQAINLLPIKLDPSRLDDGSGIEDTLRRHHANHRCGNMFSNYKLKSAAKRAAEI